MLTLPQEPGPRHRLYETMVEHIYGQELSAGDSFIDLGGNIGHHTWRMAVAVGSEGRGFAIEPVPDFAQRIRNVLANKKVDWVEVVNVAAADYDGECSFFVQPDHIGWSSMFSDHVHPGDSADSAQEITVPVKVLDDTVDVADSSLRVIKVDVENAEFPALRGSAKLLAAHKPVVIFENDPVGAARRGEYEIAEFLTFFSSLGYEVWSLHGPKMATAEDWASSDSSYYLATPRSLGAGGVIAAYELDDLVANFT